jgi:hypothetical protein
MRLGVVLGAFAAMLTATPADARYLGETYVCQFPKAGRVVINTREPGATVTWRGRVYPVSGGSYFYNTEAGEVVVYFGPGLRWWNFGDGNDRAVCPHHRNQR